MDDKPPQQPKTLTWRKSHEKTLAMNPTERNDACKIKDTCKTCTFINENYQTSLSNKYDKGINVLKKRGLLLEAKVLAPNASPKVFNYRTHAKLAVRKNNDESVEGRFAIGLIKKDADQIIDMSQCPLHRESMNRLIRDLKELLEGSHLQPYDEANQTGDVCYITIRASHVTDALMLTFIMTRKAKSEVKEFINQLRFRNHKISSAHMNLHHNDQNNESIFSDDSTLLFGSRRLREGLCDLSFEISPTSFFQVNPWTAEIVYRRIEQLAGRGLKNPVAWDLYCGIGQISLILARAGFKTLGIEQNPQATRDAQNNAANNDLQQQLHFIPGRVEDTQGIIPTWAWPPSVIVANPPKVGISEEMLAFIVRALNKGDATKFIYMSANVNSLANDLEKLQEDGYKVRQIEAFDMFPFTEKMEWLAVISR